MEERRKISSSRSENQILSKMKENSDPKLTGNIGDLLIEFGHGIAEEDKLLSSKDKNAVEFVLNYSKQWCKCLKDIVVSLEKRAFYENECMRTTGKLFQALESNFSSVVGAPLSEETVQMSKLMFEQAKEIEFHNTKRCRELLEVLSRQRTEFMKTRKYLKAKWKADVKRMVDAESALFKTKSSYFGRCQTGVKLREELAGAQSSLDEMQASLLIANAGSLPPILPSSGNVGFNSSGVLSSVDSGLDAVTPDPTLMNQFVKQKAKVERLEKQLADNDKKEIEQMYAYKELVDVANTKLCDLEKSKVEVICDTRLTVTKSDEVVSDSLAELISHLFVTRTKMLNKYEVLATSFQNYQPGNPYQQITQNHIQKGTDVVLEKYQFEGFHDAVVQGAGKDRSDAPFGKFVSRFAQLASSKDTGDGRHSDSDSETEFQPGSSSVTTGGKGGTVLSSLVEFGSNLFRPDSKKASLRQKQQRTSSSDQVNLAVQALLEANNEREYDTACYILTQCIDGIEKQPNGLNTLGIYRVPASKVKVATVFETIRPAQEDCFGAIDLRDEHPLTLASAIKTRLIGLPEPLLSYSLYDNFVVIGKALDAADPLLVEKQVKNLSFLVGQLKPSIRRVAGLIFQHLKRVSSFQAENQMGAANLATMFGPTVLRQRPKFQVANMMEYVDNKWLMMVVEVCIDRASDIFGPASDFSSETLVKVLRKRAKEVEQRKREETEGYEKEEERAENRFQSPNTSSSTPSSTATYASPFACSRERFFADMSAEGSPNNTHKQPIRIGKKIPYSDRLSLMDSKPPNIAPSKTQEESSKASEISKISEIKRPSSRNEMEMVKVSPPSPCTALAKVLLTDTASFKSLIPLDLSSSSTATSSGGISGLKRLVSTKALNLQQHFQQLTSSPSSSETKSGVSGLVIGSRKLLPQSSISSKKNKREPANLKSAQSLGADCAYIDSDATATNIHGSPLDNE